MPKKKGPIEDEGGDAVPVDEGDSSEADSEEEEEE